MFIEHGLCNISKCLRTALSGCERHHKWKKQCGWLWNSYDNSTAGSPKKPFKWLVYYKRLNGSVEIPKLQDAVLIKNRTPFDAYAQANGTGCNGTSDVVYVVWVHDNCACHQGFPHSTPMSKKSKWIFSFSKLSVFKKTKTIQ